MGGECMNSIKSTFEWVKVKWNEWMWRMEKSENGVIWMDIQHQQQQTKITEINKNI